MTIRRFPTFLATLLTCLFACAGVALAGTPTSPAGTAYTGSVKAASEGHLTFHNPIKNIDCNLVLEGEIAGHDLGLSTRIPLSSVSFSGCTNNWTPTAGSPGTLEIHATEGSGKNGIVTWEGATFGFSRLGVACRYVFGNREVGTFTSSKTTGSTATIDLSTTLLFESGSGLCGFLAEVTGNLKVGTPDYLDFDAEAGATPTSPAGTAYTGGLHASSEGHVAIDNPIIDIECDSTLEGEVESHGLGEAARIPLGSVTFNGCTNDWSATVEAPGTLELDAIAGSKNGTLTWSGAKITFFRKGITCRYKAEATDIGTLTGSKATGGTATIDLSGKLPLDDGDKLCGEEPGALTGSYSVETPDYLDVDAGLGATPTSPADTVYTGDLSAVSEGHFTIDNPILPISCNSTLEGEVASHDAGEPVGIPLSSLTLTGCTNDWAPTVVAPGTLDVHSVPGSDNGTVTWSGATLSFFRKGITCVYRTEATVVGTLTSSKSTGATATIDLRGNILHHSGSSPLCGKGPSPVTGSYSVVTPDYLDIDS